MAESYQLFDAAKNLEPGFQAMNLSRKATMLNHTNEPEQAREVINQALEIVKVNQIENYDTLGRLYNELARSYNYVDDELAIKHIDKAIQYGKLVNVNNSFIYLRQQTKAVILIRLKRYDEALAAIEEGKKASKSCTQKIIPNLPILLVKKLSFTMIWVNTKKPNPYIKKSYQFLN